MGIEELFSIILPAAKRLLEYISEAPQTSGLANPKVEFNERVKQIADDVAGIRDGIDRLMSEVQKLPSVITETQKYTIQLQAAARRESAAKALKLGILDEALKGLTEAERLEPVTYELWVLFVFYRCKASEMGVSAVPAHSVDEELQKAVTLTMADGTLNLNERLVIFYALLVAALWHRSRAAAENILTQVDAILTAPDVLTLANSMKLLAPFRQLALGELSPQLDGAERCLRLCYNRRYQELWQELRTDKCNFASLRQFIEEARKILPAPEVLELVYLEELSVLAQQKAAVRFSRERASAFGYESNQKWNLAGIKVLLIPFIFSACLIVLLSAFLWMHPEDWIPYSALVLFFVIVGAVIGIFLVRSFFKSEWFVSLYGGFCYGWSIIGSAWFKLLGIPLIFCALAFPVLYVAWSSPFIAVAILLLLGVCAPFIIFTGVRIGLLVTERLGNVKSYAADVQDDLDTKAQRDAENNAATARLEEISKRKSELMLLSDPSRRPAIAP